MCQQQTEALTQTMWKVGVDTQSSPNCHRMMHTYTLTLLTPTLHRHSQSQALTPTHTQTPELTHSHALTFTLTHSHILTGSHTLRHLHSHTHTSTHTLTHELIHSHTYICTHTHSQFHSHGQIQRGLGMCICELSLSSSFSFLRDQCHQGVFPGSER